MKKVPITFILNEFYYEGIKYKHIGAVNTRFLCQEVDHPDKKVQISSYSTVEVEDKEASRILFYMEDILRATRSRLIEIEEGIRSLKEQGVKEELLNEPM